jgi:transcriptional regulator GlxA family with amidase domain
VDSRIEAGTGGLTKAARVETSRSTLDEIAAAVGFGSTVSLRQQFVSVLRVSPGRYRQQFGRAPDVGAGARRGVRT